MAISRELAREALDAYTKHGSATHAAIALGLARSTFRDRLAYAQNHCKPFEVPKLPQEDEPLEELLARRKKGFHRKAKAKEARKLIDVKIQIDGPIAITHLGDPHVDDDGCDIGKLENDLDIIRKTQGMFAANLGDMQNNWIGRLQALYAQQSTTAKESWRLVEWMLNSTEWLYLVGGNHDAWSGNGDPLQWITRSQAGVFENYGVRLNLKFPNNRSARINARHDFHGKSELNPVHGASKAIQRGWRDHILTCGHTHTSFIAGPHKCPASGLLSWAIRCAGYKTYDRYAEELGLPDQNAFAACVTIIDPQYADDDNRMITVIPDVQEGADFLNFKRKKYERSRK